MRQIVLDTETTGISPARGDRVIEVGCVELVRGERIGRYFHSYLRPDCRIHPGAARVHGLTASFLADKPCFEEIADELLDFLGDAQLIIHNAPFDLRFLDAEYARVYPGFHFSGGFRVFDTLAYARQRHPRQRNGLDHLCQRYGIDNSRRTVHGALMDAQILAEVYLALIRADRV